MKSTTARRTTLPVAVAAALTGVTACGFGGPSRGPDGAGGAAERDAARMSSIAALRSADASTAEADSARVSMTTSIGTLMSMKGSGTVAWGRGLTGRLTLTYTGGTALETMRRVGTTSMEARYLPDAYYARMGDVFAEQAGGGRHWIRYRYEDLGRLAGGSGAYLREQLRNSTPNQTVKLLLASGDVRRVGEATIRGERTTHYRGTVNIADFAGRSSNLPRSELEALRRQLSQAGVTTESIDIWINDRSLLVKKVERADTAAGTMTNTAYYSDYGIKVAVQEPPADDTRDFKDLMRTQGSAGGGS